MTDSPSTTIRLGTRGSLLARSQSQVVADEVERRSSGTVHVELVIVKTSGDRVTDQPLRDIGGKGLWTKELEQALLAREIDFAVHSFKDVPVTMPLVEQDELVIASVPQREDPRDVLIATKADAAPALAALPRGARVGTSSLRRRSQILATRGDLVVDDLRGNIDTRLRKLRSGDYDAIVLAMAGLRRTGLFDERCMTALTFDELLPAAGQGALALQCRRDDGTRDLLASLHHEASEACARAERAVVANLHGDCHSPIAALAAIEGPQLHLRVVVGGKGGSRNLMKAEAKGEPGDVSGVVKTVTESLNRQGVQALLHGVR